MRLLLVAAAAVSFALPVAAQNLTARADSVMRAAEASGFSGVVRIEKDGALVLEKGYGLANRAANTPFTPSTVVQIGSNTKDFTAVSILQLQEKGLLSLADRIGKYFPTAPADKQSITIQMLMNHRAGFPIGLGPDFAELSRQDLIDAAMKTKLLFTPGERNNYSNTGFALLAAIIEQVSGKTYDEYVRDNILNPLGLTDTGFHLPNFATSRLAHGYSSGGKDEGTMLSKPHAVDGPFWNLRGNGGMLSTVGDMHAFYKALFESETLVKFGSRGDRFDPNSPVGLAGSDLISFFLYERDPIAKTEIIIASNNSEAKAPAVRQALAKVLGLPDAQIERGGPRRQPLAQRTGKPASPEQAKIAADFVRVVNTADRAVIRPFIVDRFVNGPDGPSIDERLERLSSMKGNLGTLEILGVTVGDDGGLQVQLRTSNEPQATLIMYVEPAAPHRILRLSMMVGGG